MILTFTLEIDGDPVDPDDQEVWFDDPLNAYGIRRTDTNAIVVARLTPMVRQSAGVYTYNLVEPEPDLQYEYYVNWLLDGAPQSQYRLVGEGGGGGGAPDPTPYVGRYTSSARLYAKFGEVNVRTWATFEDADDVEDIQERLEAMIIIAEDYIDDALRGARYTVPFTGTIPETIRDIATMLAGVELYEARGVEDVEDGQPVHRLGFIRRMAIQKLNDIKTGAIRLNVTEPFMTRYPQVVADVPTSPTPTGNPGIFTDLEALPPYP